MSHSSRLNRFPARSALMSWAITAAVILGVSAPLASARAADDTPPMAHEGHGPHGEMGMMPMGRHLDHLLDEIKATPAQRQQIKQITEKAHTDMQALHEQGKALHERGMAWWTAPKLDPAEAEKMRQQMLAHHDQVSKRMMQAMLDVGNVLTPEQRAKAGESMKARRASMGQRLRGWMHGDKRGQGPEGGHEGGHGQAAKNTDSKSPVDH